MFLELVKKCPRELTWLFPSSSAVGQLSCRNLTPLSPTTREQLHSRKQTSYVSFFVTSTMGSATVAPLLAEGCVSTDLFSVHWTCVLSRTVFQIEHNRSFPFEAVKIGFMLCQYTGTSEYHVRYVCFKIVTSGFGVSLSVTLCVFRCVCRACSTLTQSTECVCVSVSAPSGSRRQIMRKSKLNLTL